jgi:hypothetical protein
VLVGVAAPVGERKLDRLQRREHDRRVDERLDPPAGVREERVAEVRESEQGERGDRREELDELVQVPRPVIAAAALDGVRCEAVHGQLLTRCAVV